MFVPIANIGRGTDTTANVRQGRTTQVIFTISIHHAWSWVYTHSESLQQRSQGFLRTFSPEFWQFYRLAQPLRGGNLDQVAKCLIPVFCFEVAGKRIFVIFRFKGYEFEIEVFLVIYAQVAQSSDYTQSQVSNCYVS